MPISIIVFIYTMHLNFEFKAKANNLIELEEKLKPLHPVFIGEDLQTDTYFNVPNGRMKLREGNIENALIYYRRSNIADAKQSDVILYQHEPDAGLKNALVAALGIMTIVEKKRKIYFVENVKFHFDTVTGIGNFIEVEAIDKEGTIGIEKLKEQCSFYADFFEIKADDFVADSYSDLLLRNL
jgi:predicted adenylyl cyclase CyaB